MSFLSDIADFVSPVTDLITPGVGSALAGGLGFLGGMQTNQANADIANANSAFNANQAQLNRDFQAKQTQQAMDYQTQMSNTSYQRSVKDMEAAGLNPMLAYMKGGASTPSISPASGSTAQAQGAVMQNPALSLASAARDISSASQASSQIDLANANAQKIIEEIRNVPKEGNRLDAMVAMLYEQKQLLFKKGLNETDIGNNLRQTLLKIKAETGKLISEKELVDFDVEAAKGLDNIGRSSAQLKPIVDMIRAIFK